MCASHGNLTPFDTMPPERHKEISRLGGLASGAKRRWKGDLLLSYQRACYEQKIIEKVCADFTDEVFAFKLKQKLLQKSKKLKK